MKNEFAIVSNLLVGPWSGAAFHHEVSEAAEEYFKSRDETDGLYLLLYASIVEDLSGSQAPSDFGSQAHVRSTWEAIKVCEIF